tara:strand:+ start:522 stop:1418 length:897 start_codon:yes stop_codon:yes gene_type:complete
MKVLITGCDGQLGNEIIKSKPNGISLISTNKENFDLKDLSKCRNFILNKKPNWIINCAAYTKVDKAESERNLAYMINALSVKNLAEAMKEINGNFIQISTDYVFNGKKNIPYQPNDIKSPINIYGETKSLAEDFLKEIFKNSGKGIIIRTSWLMGSTGQNFALKILKLLLEKKSINIIDDQIGSPTTTKTLAKACWSTIKTVSKGKKIPSILHCTNSGKASWYEIALEINKIARNLGIINYPITINPIKSSDYQTLAKRPRYSVLDSKESLESIFLEVDCWEKSLEALFLDYINLQSK